VEVIPLVDREQIVAPRALLKRSFQTFVIGSRTMSLLILLSPTLRSTKTMGSSTTSASLSSRP